MCVWVCVNGEEWGWGKLARGRAPWDRGRKAAWRQASRGRWSARRCEAGRVDFFSHIGTTGRMLPHTPCPNIAQRRCNFPAFPCFVSPPPRFQLLPPPKTTASVTVGSLLQSRPYRPQPNKSSEGAPVPCRGRGKTECRTHAPHSWDCVRVGGRRRRCGGGGGTEGCVDTPLLQRYEG
jgi:hypothetical protein